jgi:hypothetical protein
MMIGVNICTSSAMKLAMFLLNTNKLNILINGLRRAYVKCRRSIASKILQQWAQKTRDHAWTSGQVRHLTTRA